MTMFCQVSTGASEPERLVAILALLGVLIFAGWRGWRWFLQSQPVPDPWDENVTAEIDGEDAVPLCHRCLAPNPASEDFCPACGAPVGQYTNWLPFPQLFSVGHLLRIGTSGEFKRTPLTILGFLLLSLGEYMLFVPIYWIVFLHKLFGSPQTSNHPGESSPPPTTPAN